MLKFAFVSLDYRSMAVIVAGNRKLIGLLTLPFYIAHIVTNILHWKGGLTDAADKRIRC